MNISNIKTYFTSNIEPIICKFLIVAIPSLLGVSVVYIVWFLISFNSLSTTATNYDELYLEENHNIVCYSGNKLIYKNSHVGIELINPYTRILKDNKVIATVNASCLITKE